MRRLEVRHVRGRTRGGLLLCTSARRVKMTNACGASPHFSSTAPPRRPPQSPGAAAALLHFHRRDVLPAADDDVLEPVAHFRVPIGVDDRRVSAVEPAVSLSPRPVAWGSLQKPAITTLPRATIPRRASLRRLDQWIRGQRDARLARSAGRREVGRGIVDELRLEVDEILELVAPELEGRGAGEVQVGRRDPTGSVSSSAAGATNPPRCRSRTRRNSSTRSRASAGSITASASPRIGRRGGPTPRERRRHRRAWSTARSPRRRRTRRTSSLPTPSPGATAPIGRLPPGARMRPVTVIDQIQQGWSNFLALLSKVVIPDWAALDRPPAPPPRHRPGRAAASLAVLAWLGYGVTKPRTKVTYDEGTRVAPRDHLGRIIPPVGEPYCPVDGLIHPSGRQRCDQDKTRLLLVCPKCQVVREAGIPTCANCGLDDQDRAAGDDRRHRRAAGRRRAGAAPRHSDPDPAPPPPRDDQPKDRRTSRMNILATILFPIGTVAIAIAFAAHVGHAVLLANGRRSIGLALPAARQPAWAGAVTGSFVDRAAHVAAPDSPLAPLGVARRPLGRRRDRARPAAGSRRSLVPRSSARDRRRARAVGQHVRVHASRSRPRSSAATCSSSAATRSARSASSRSASRSPCCCTRRRLPSDIEPLVPALQNPPLLTIHVGMAVLSYGIFATSFAAGVGYLSRARRTASPGCRRTRCSTRSPTAR